VGNFEPKKMTPNCNALAKSINSYLWVSYFTFAFYWQCKTMLFTKQKNMQWRHRSEPIALRDINKKGLEIGELQNRFHNDMIKFMLKIVDLSLAVLNLYICCISLVSQFNWPCYVFLTLKWRTLHLMHQTLSQMHGFLWRT